MKAVCISLALILLIGCQAIDQQGKVTSPLPQDGFLDGWKRVGEIAVFDGPGLYGHINGGSEVFLELGFDKLDLQNYANGEENLSVEIYYMTDPVAALGIFLMNQRKNSLCDPSFKELHTLNPYQVQFLKGSAYVKIINSGDIENAEKTLLAFADYAADSIPKAADMNLFKPLPEEGRIEKSERIIRGPFTLERIYTLGTTDLLQLNGKVTAVSADYDDGAGETYSKIVVNYGEDEAAKSAFASLCSGLDPYLEVTLNTNARLVFKDFAGKFGEARRLASSIQILVNLVKAPAAP